MSCKIFQKIVDEKDLIGGGYLTQEEVERVKAMILAAKKGERPPQSTVAVWALTCRVPTRLRTRPCPSLVTCRPVEQAGHMHAQRSGLWDQAAKIASGLLLQCC